MERERSVSPLPDRKVEIVETHHRVPVYEEKVIETRVPVVERVERIVEQVPVHHSF